MGKKRKGDNQEPPTDATVNPRRGSRHRARNMVNLPDDLYRALKEEAEANDRPVAWQLRVILRAHYLRKRSQQPPPP